MLLPSPVLGELTLGPFVRRTSTERAAVGRRVRSDNGAVAYQRDCFRREAIGDKSAASRRTGISGSLPHPLRV